MPKEDLTTTSAVTYEEDLEDLGYNADLYVFNDETFEGCSSSYGRIRRRRERQTDRRRLQSLSLNYSKLNELIWMLSS